MIPDNAQNVKQTLSPEIILPEVDKFRLGTPQEQPGRRAQVDFWAGLGCKFVLLAPNDKRPIGRNWQDQPQPARRAIAHTGNVGIAAGKHSDNIVFIDLDCNAREFLAQFPDLANSLIIWRDDAPDRLKIALRITDLLPRSANHKRPNQSQPDTELLSTGRQAFVLGIHPTGAVMRNNGKQPLPLAFGDLSAIWRKWTGQELPDPTATKTRTLTDAQRALRNATPQHSDNTLAQRVRAVWSVLDVLERHSITGDRRDEGAGQLRILGNGGLIIDTVGDRWYQHAGQVGGDCISAWAWCTRGSVELTPAQFVTVCGEMLEAKGESLPEQRSTVDWDALLEQYSQPESYPKGRTNTFDRGAMLAILGIMRGAGSTVVKASTRQVAEIMGAGHKTAWKAMRRLLSYGLIGRADLPKWHTGAVNEQGDEDLINVFEAYAYQLLGQAQRGNGDQSELTTVRSTRRLVLCTVVNSDRCETGQTNIALDAHTLQAWADSDAFQWGAKVTDTTCRLGRGALDVIAALVVCNDQTTAELAEETGRSRSGLSPILRTLADLGIVERYTESRTAYWYLRDGWQDILQRYISSLTTFCRTVKRKIRHLRERIDRVCAALGIADSGLLRAHLCEMLDRWRRRLTTLRDELTRLQSLVAA